MRKEYELLLLTSASIDTSVGYATLKNTENALLAYTLHEDKGLTCPGRNEESTMGTP